MLPLCGDAHLCQGKEVVDAAVGGPRHNKQENQQMYPERLDSDQKASERGVGIE